MSAPISKMELILRYDYDVSRQWIVYDDNMEGEILAMAPTPWEAMEAAGEALESSRFRFVGCE